MDWQFKRILLGALVSLLVVFYLIAIFGFQLFYKDDVEDSDI